nr:MAG TPA: TrfB transcriptional repressor protein/DNA Complex-turn-helix, complex, transcription.5A [Caudoviricetes sp.]
MNTQHREIRARLSRMAPQRAVDYVKAFDLPPMEEACIIECDVRGRSCVDVAMDLFVSPDTIKNCRRRAYGKIADGISYGIIGTN